MGEQIRQDWWWTDNWLSLVMSAWGGVLIFFLKICIFFQKKKLGKRAHLKVVNLHQPNTKPQKQCFVKLIHYSTSHPSKGKGGRPNKLRPFHRRSWCDLCYWSNCAPTSLLILWHTVPDILIQWPPGVLTMFLLISSELN